MRLIALLLAVCISSLSATAAFADPPSGRNKQPERGDYRPNRGNDAARRAQQMNGGGRVLSVETVAGGHRVKLLKDGEVRVVFVPE